MAFRNSTTEYGSIAKSLHWLVAIGILVLVFLGLTQADMPRGPERSEIRTLHASLALAVFFLMTVRLIWRFMNTTPLHPDSQPAWQRVAASIVHWGLYVTVFVQLIAGAMVVATGGRGLPFFGWFSIPLPVEEHRGNHEWWEEVHEYAWRAIAVLLVAHVLAALAHHFVAKSDVLRRMTVGIPQQPKE